MKKIKAILFDLDGVLVDAREWHYLALNRALERYGTKISKRDHREIFDGLPTIEKLKILSKKNKVTKENQEEIFAEKQRQTKKLIQEKCRQDTKKTEMLQKLKKEGYFVAVCSNAIRESVKQMLELTGLLDNIDFYLSNQDVSNPKPDPEIYLLAISKLSVLPEECLVVEDNEKGVVAAEKSGAWVLKVRSPEEVFYEKIKEHISYLEKK